MLGSLLPIALTGLLQVTGVFAADDPPSCALGKKCPKSAPCCSQYGQCGVGAFCLGGCDPRMSYSLDSCVPAPVCKSKKYDMDSLDRVANMDEYLGEADKYDWVYQGKTKEEDGNILLLMEPEGRSRTGTVMASSTYMWYGTVKAKMKTSRGAGVVSAFILYSDVKDEIDYEFIGTDLETAQTNYYFQGIPLYDQGENLTVSSSTYDDWHEYEIRWTPDEITWAIDGKVGRTKKKSDTWNETFSQWDFPQTPSRVQLSIWPGGLDTNEEGTIDWAGGPIDWDHEDVKDDGYFSVAFSEITVECYDADSPPGTNKGKSYIYNDELATNDTVEDTNKRTNLKSLAGSGLDMDAEDDSDDGSNNVPGNSGGGTGSHGGGGSGGGSGCSTDSFSQSCSSSDDEEGDEGAATRMGASALGVVVAVGAMLWL